MNWKIFIGDSCGFYIVDIFDFTIRLKIHRFEKENLEA